MVKILGNTHLSDLLLKRDENTRSVNIEDLILAKKPIDESQRSCLALTELSNKLIIQRMTVEVLPNDVKIIN